MVDLISAIGAANQAISIAKAMRDIDKAYDQVALKSQIVDLMDKLQDVRGSLQDVRDAIGEKDAEIAKLSALLDKRSATIEHNGFRYTPSPSDPTKPMGTPFCLRCDQVSHRLVGTVDNVNGRGVICPECKSEYGRGATQFLWSNEPSAVVAAESRPRAVDGTYTFDGDDGNYCTGCYDTARRKVTVHRTTGPATIFGKWHCPSCGNHTG